MRIQKRGANYEKKKWYIAANEYATAKIEDVLALEDEDIKTTEKILS